MASGKPILQIQRRDLGIAVSANGLGLAFACAPWIRWETPDGIVGHEAGTYTDGVILIMAAIIALIVTGVLRNDRGSISSVIAFGASMIGFLAAGVMLMFIDSIVIDAVEGPLSVCPAWGIISATIVTAIAAFFTYRVMRTSQVYKTK